MLGQLKSDGERKFAKSGLIRLFEHHWQTKSVTGLQMGGNLLLKSGLDLMEHGETKV